MNRSVILLILIMVMSVFLTGCFDKQLEESDVPIEKNQSNVVSTDTDESRGISEEDVIIEEVTINSDEELDFGELI